MARKKEGFIVWNPGKASVRTVSLEDLEEISVEIREVVGTVQSLADELDSN